VAIPEEFLSELRDRVDIVDVVGSYVRLKKAGANYKALCPFHKEKTPSFMVNRERGIYKCFGCGASGNAITFVMETQKVGFVEAVKTLAARVGMKVPVTDSDPARSERYERLYEALEFAAQQAEDLLWNSGAGRRAREYLQERGISTETARTFRLGYADPSGVYLVRKARGLPVWPALGAAGMVLEGRSGPRDMFRNRLLFPICNASGRVVGFGGRSLDGTEPKYINTRESLLFRKGSLLYGLTQAKPRIRESGAAILVEGYTDVIALHQAGFRNAVASAGTAMTEAQAAGLKRYADTVIVAFDGDEAGRNAALRSLEVLLGAGLDVRVAPLDPGEDPDSAVRKTGRDGFQRTLDEAVDAVAFAAVHEGGNPREREAAMRRVAALLAAAGDPVRRRILTEKAADVLGVPEEVLADAARAATRGGRWSAPEPPGAEEPSPEAIPPLEREFLRSLLLAPALLGEVLECFDPGLLRNSEGRKLFELVVERWRHELSCRAADLMDRCEDAQTRALIGEVAVEWEGETVDAERAVRDCMRRLRERSLRDRMETIKTEMRRKEATGLQDEVNRLAHQLRDITEQLRTLAHGAS